MDDMIILYCVLFQTIILMHSTSAKSVIVELINTEECPRICRCHVMANSSVITDCSTSNISVLPTNISPMTTKLNLSNNFLGKFNNQTLSFFNLTNLIYLDLSHNELKKLENSTFLGLKKLRFLSLAYNQLGYPTCLADGIFKPLVMLQDLRLQANCNTRSKKCTYHDFQFKELKSLRRLTTDGLTNTVLGPGFSYLRELRYLCFYRGESMLGDVSANTFANLENTKLKTLIMIKTHVDRVMPNSFSMLKHLKTLDLSRNNRLCEDGMRNVTTGLNQTMIQILRLSKTCDRGQDVKGQSFASLQNSSLISLDLSHCKIRNISAEFILILPKTLKILLLNNNIISDGFFLILIPTMPSLVYLDGSAQNYFYEHNDTLDKQASRENDDFSVRALDHYTSYQSVHKSKNFKDKSYILGFNNSTKGQNGRHIFHNTLSIPFPNPVVLPPKLRFLNVSFLSIGRAISPFNVSEQNCLEVIDISNCKFQRLKGTITGLNSLKYLNLSHNEIMHVSPVTFVDMPALLDLNLSNNRLGKSLNQQESEIFFHLENLRILDMSGNDLKQLPTSIFNSNRYLYELKLANNGFVTVTFSLESLVNLKLLDLSHNGIIYIQSETTTQLSSLSDSHLIQINLQGNPLKCNCEHKSFVHWLAETSGHVQFVDNSSLMCTYINNTRLNVSSIKSNLTRFKIECVTWEVITSCVMGFFVLLIVFAAVASIYSQRWKLRYLYYSSRSKINPYHPLLGEQIDLDIDCYFSFDESLILTNGDDNSETTMYNFVTEVIFPYIQRQQQKLQLSFRGLLADNLPLYQTISNAVRHSKKVVVMLSTTYCEEFWNVFEFNMAAYEGIYTRRDIIILVLVGDLERRHLTGEVKAFIAGKHVLHLKPNGDYSGILDSIIQMIQR